MEKSLSLIKNKLKCFVPFQKINPHKHWVILLTIFSIVIAILILFSFYLLFEIKNRQIFQIVEKKIEQPSLINEKLLIKVNESFQDKSIKEKDIKNGDIFYKDPSLQ